MLQHTHTAWWALSPTRPNAGLPGGQIGDRGAWMGLAMHTPESSDGPGVFRESRLPCEAA